MEPVFFKNSDVSVENNKWLTHYEICIECEEVIQASENADKNITYVVAAQKIGDLWRVYLNDEMARVNLLMQGITLRGLHVELKDQNPFRVIGFENYETTRLFIRNVPLSFDNKEIEKFLVRKGVKFVNSMKYARARDPAGKLTNFLTGDRFVDIIIPDEPLPKTLKMGVFVASLYHREQKMAEKQCGNCMEKGHIRKECPNEIVCYDCREVGHKKGDPSCKAKFDEYRSTTSEIPDAAGVDSDGGVVSDNENENADDENGMVDDENGKDKENDENVLPKQPVSKHPAPKDKQGLITAFQGFAAGLHFPKAGGNRSASPASRRKLDDRSPEDKTLSQGQKKSRNTHKNK